MRKRFSLLLVLFLLTALPAWGSSWLYSTTSGDILDEKANPKPTYGITRIDFEDNKPIPTVILADDEFATAVGEFQKDSKQYIYATRVDKDKEKTDNKELTKLYAVCDPAGGVDVLADKTKYRELTLPKNQNVSVDIDLSPDDYNGLIYYIDGNDGTSTPVLTAKDAVTWTDVASTTLSKEYDAHGVVSLLPESCNFFYVWSTKREAAKTATCPYTSISSDVSVYDRSTLAHLTTFHHVRTGFDTTLQSADDEPLSYSMGRGLVVIVSDQEDIKNNKAAALVVYDDADSPAAHIVRIDESGTIPTEEVIVKSSDINGWNIDIESPMPDYDGGLYFACYSGDVNATGTKADGTDNQIDVYLWDGVSSTYTKQIGTTQNGVEIEKPFTDGGNGLYFMAERKRSQAEGGDEADALFWWNGSNDPKLIWSSDCEMEVEGEVVPKDGKNGFYFVNVSTDLTNDSKKGTVSLQLLHTRRADTPPYNFVCDLGSFAVPESRFHAKDKATGAVLSPKEALEDEYGFLEDSEHKVLFVGGGPLGGKYKLTVLEWTDKTLGDLTANHIKMTFTDEELGGAANIAGAVRFTEGVTTHNYSSGGGCGGSSGGGYTVSSKRYILVGELASKRLDGSDLIPYIRKRVTKSIDLTNNLDEAIDILPGLTSGDVVSLCPEISNIWFG